MRENVATFVHGKLTVEGNIFKKPADGKHRFLLQHLKEAVIKNNIFDAEFEINKINTGKIITE